MSITFHPKRGMVLMCDFASGFKPPEMVKKRPVVVVGEGAGGRYGTCTVIPLSTTRPSQVAGYHVLLKPESLPTRLRGGESWAKCDMIATVACARLDRVMNHKTPAGKRIYTSHLVTESDLRAIHRGVLVALHLTHVAKYLDSAPQGGA